MVSFVKDKYSKKQPQTRPSADDFNEYLNQQMLMARTPNQTVMPVEQQQMDTPVSASMLASGDQPVTPVITPEEQQRQEAYNQVLPSTTPTSTAGKGKTEKPGFMKKLADALGNVNQSDLMRIGAGLAAGQGNIDLGNAYVGTAGQMSQREEAAADRKMRANEAEAQRTYDWRKLKATLDAQAAKNAAKGIEDPRKPLGYEGLAKHTAVRQGLEQVTDNIVPLAESGKPEDIKKLKKMWYTNIGKSAEEQKLKTSYMNAAEAVIRAESGAAVPPEEIARLAKRFQPNPTDTDEQVKNKVATLQKRLNDMKMSTESLYQTGEGATENQQVTNNPTQPTAQVGKYKIISVE